MQLAAMSVRISCYVFDGAGWLEEQDLIGVMVWVCRTWQQRVAVPGRPGLGAARAGVVSELHGADFSISIAVHAPHDCRRCQ